MFSAELVKDIFSLKTQKQKAKENNQTNKKTNSKSMGNLDSGNEKA